MSELTALLCEILRAEYAQWMRYAYLSALRFGPFADALIEHFEEHYDDELEHASVVRRWIVDLGGVPPTDMSPVEPYNGSLEGALEWLLEAEIDGINKYQLANALADGIAGLQNDIGEILSEEHEHVSDLMKWTQNSFGNVESDDPVIIVLAASYKKFASDFRSFRRYANIKKRADNVRDYLKEVLQMAWYKFEYDYTPEKAQQYVLEDTQKMVENLWERHKSGEDVRSALQFYVNLYKTVQSRNPQQWEAMHAWVWPDYQEWLASDAKQEIKTEDEKVPFSQLMEQHVEPELKKPTQPKVDIPKQVQPALGQPIPKQQKIDMLKKMVEFPGRGEETRRPIEQAGTIFVYDAGKSRTGKEPTIEVSAGDRVKNMTLSGEGIPETGRPGRAKYTEGVIEEITPDGLLLVNTGSGKQEWNPDVDLIEIDAREREKILSKQP
jgi:bacterioferritin (cytochrome b1)